MSTKRCTCHALPPELERYREFLEAHAGGNEIEDLLHRIGTNRNLAQTNSIVWAIAYGVEEQIIAIEDLTTKHDRPIIVHDAARPFRPAAIKKGFYGTLHCFPPMGQSAKG